MHTHQFTLVVASSCGGDILPFQSVWGGTSDASLPKATASRRAEADALGFTYDHGDTRHWSSLETTKNVSTDQQLTVTKYNTLTYSSKWVQNTLIKHFDKVRAEENLPPDSPGILYIDAWPVHTAKSSPECFIPWMTRNHPNIKLIFVPAGCELSEYMHTMRTLTDINRHWGVTTSRYPSPAYYQAPYQARLPRFLCRVLDSTTSGR